MKRRKLIFICTFLLAIFLAGCGNNTDTSSTNNENNEQTDQLIIYTTIYPLEDFAKKIGGDHVVVQSIMPPGSNAHTYEPTTKEMINIAEADAFIYNGLGLEGFATKIAEALENEDTMMVEAAHGVDVIERSADHQHEHETDDANTEEAHSDEAHEHDTADTDTEEEHSDEAHEHGDVDPHVWIDPYRAITIAENIKNTLVELKPETKEEFEQNYQQLVADLQELDNEFKALVETKQDPKIIVSHAGYGYWEERYGIRQIAVSGLSPTNEPSQQELEELINIANEENIKYIIYEQNITTHVADVIRKEINAEPLRIHNLAVLTDEDINNGEDYFSLMKKNIETLQIALQ